MAAAVPFVNSMRLSLVACGVNDVALFGGRTQAQRIAAEVFNDDFMSCQDCYQGIFPLFLYYIYEG